MKIVLDVLDSSRIRNELLKKKNTKLNIEYNKSEHIINTRYKAKEEIAIKSTHVQSTERMVSSVLAVVKKRKEWNKNDWCLRPVLCHDALFFPAWTQKEKKSFGQAWARLGRRTRLRLRLRPRRPVNQCMHVKRRTKKRSKALVATCGYCLHAWRRTLLLNNRATLHSTLTRSYGTKHIQLCTVLHLHSVIVRRSLLDGYRTFKWSN